MKQAKRIYINSHPDQPEGADGLSAAFESRGSRPGSWPGAKYRVCCVFLNSDVIIPDLLRQWVTEIRINFE